VLWASSNRAIHVNDRRARLERYDFKASPVRYVYPTSNPSPLTAVFTPDSPGEALLSAEFSWAVGAGMQNAGAARVATSDGRGNEFDVLAQTTTGFIESDGREYWVYSAPVFPRRGKNVRLRVLSNEEIFGEFEIPNPDPGPHPTWTAQPLPASAADRELEASLVKFRARHIRETGRWADLFSRTECVFTLRENAQTTVAWRPALFEISDATGNRWLTGSDARFSGVEETNVRTAFPGALWPGESAWKLRVEFRRVANFPATDLLRIPNIRIPAADQVEEPQTQYDHQGAAVELAFVIGPDVKEEETSRLNVERKKGCITIVLTGQQQILAQNKQLRFVGATDDLGRRVELAGSWGPETSSTSVIPFSFVFAPASGARELNLVVAISECRFLEFLAKPEQVKE